MCSRMLREGSELADNEAVIGRIIAKYAPEGWKRAWIEATAADGYIGNLTSDYVDAEGRENWFDISDAGDVMTLTNALLALREQTKQDGQAGFSRVTFTLICDGQFKLDAGYEDQPVG